jgi:uncharacterized protein YbjT (DUF2867 family)
MTEPILITGAAGRVGGIGRTVTELLLKQGVAVRAMVRTDDRRAQALREVGAEVVVGDLLDLDTMHRAVAGCERMFFGMSISETYLAAAVNAAAVAKHHGVKAFVNLSQMTVAQMSVTETTASPQHKLHWLAEQALNWSGLPFVHVRPTVLLEGFFLIFTTDSVREWDQIRLPFGGGKTSPVAVEDVARSVATVLAEPRPHIGKTYHLTGPESQTMHAFAKEYSEALGRTITYVDIPVETWRNELLGRGLPAHLVNHLVTMADLRRAGRYDRISDDVFALTGRPPLSVFEFVRQHPEPSSVWRFSQRRVHRGSARRRPRANTSPRSQRLPVRRLPGPSVGRAVGGKRDRPVHSLCRCDVEGRNRDDRRVRLQAIREISKGPPTSRQSHHFLMDAAYKRQVVPPKRRGTFHA